MTSRDLLHAVARRWLLVNLAIALTVLAIYGTTFAKGVYWTSVDVVFIPPSRDNGGNVIEGQSETLVHFASLIDQELRGARDDINLLSPSASLFGQGAREGVAIRLPDTGGQWLSSFQKAQLKIEAVGPTPSVVDSLLREALRDVVGAVDERQVKSGVKAGDRITTILSPQQPTVEYVGVDRRRAAVAFFVAGTGAALAAVVHVEGRRRHGGRME